jgi:hypothetical protein
MAMLTVCAGIWFRLDVLKYVLPSTSGEPMLNGTSNMG